MANKATHEFVSDRISSLPDPLVSHILSFLPVKEVVRTSVLSPRWRYLFTCMSTFDFRSPLIRGDTNKIKYFVDRLFFYNNQMSLECFRVNDFWLTDNDSSEEDYLRIHGWICAALWRGVKEIDIEFEMELDNDFELPTFLFTSRSLVTLKLSFRKHIDVPTAFCLPNLKTLHLSNIKFRGGGGSIHRIIYSLRVLEYLAIYVCRLEGTTELDIHNHSLKILVLHSVAMDIQNFDDVIVINAPSLVYFQYNGVVGKGYTLRNMDSLQNAYLDLRSFFPDREQIVTPLLQGIRNAGYLHLAVAFGLERLPRMLLDERLAFPNLVEMSFADEYDYREWKGTRVVEFLQFVPNLKKLSMSLIVPREEVFRDLAEEVPSCLSFHLKEITISNFKEDTHMFELITYFSMVLEKLVIRKGKLSEENQLRILDNLLSFRKNQRNVRSCFASILYGLMLIV